MRAGKALNIFSVDKFSMKEDMEYLPLMAIGAFIGLLGFTILAMTHNAERCELDLLTAKFTCFYGST